MRDTLRTALHAIVATNERYDAQRKTTDAMVAELNAILADLKRARQGIEREFSKTRHTTDAAERQPVGSRAVHQAAREGDRETSRREIKRAGAS